MSSPDCAEPIDAAAVRMRTATIKAAVLLGYIMCATGGVYAALTWTHPHRAALIVVLIVGTTGTAIVAHLPGERVVRSAYREAFFLGWSLLDLAVITAGALCDGGTSSPLSLAIFLPVVFSATSYPRRSVAVVGGLSLAGYVFWPSLREAGRGPMSACRW